MSRAKGGRNRRKITGYFENTLGYVVRRVEKTERYAKEKDLFGLIFGEHWEEESDKGFDILCLGHQNIALVQCKSNTPAKQKFYRMFAKKYACDFIDVVVATWIDRKGLLLQYYEPHEDITKIFIDIKDIDLT